VIPQLIETQNQILYFTWQDILASDKLGKLGCTLTAVKEMNWYLSSAQNINLLQVSMGGGYSPEITIIEAHANTYIEQLKIYSKKCTNLNSNPCN
jgi:acetoin utilization deacetylase AcuC-like enzyme